MVFVFLGSSLKAGKSVKLPTDTHFATFSIDPAHIEWLGWSQVTHHPTQG